LKLKFVPASWAGVLAMLVTTMSVAVAYYQCSSFGFVVRRLTAFASGVVSVLRHYTRKMDWGHWSIGCDGIVDAGLREECEKYKSLNPDTKSPDVRGNKKTATVNPLATGSITDIQHNWDRSKSNSATGPPAKPGPTDKHTRTPEQKIPPTNEIAPIGFSLGFP
jgi:hypothetical protein